MKKKLFLIFLTLFICSIAKSQISIGPKVGVNFSSITGKTDLIEKEFLIGFNAGAILNIEINNIFSVQPELYFSQQGYKTTKEIFDTPAKTIDRINYLNMPVLAKLTLGKGNLKGYVNLGPYLGYMVGGKNIIQLENSEAEKSKLILDYYKRFDFGVLSGVGVIFKTGSNSLFIDARYSWGINSIINGYIFEEGKDKNSIVGISIGYLFLMGV